MLRSTPKVFIFALFLSILPNAFGNLCDAECFDEMETYFKTYSGYKKWAKQFRGSRYRYTGHQAEADYIDGVTEEGKVRKTEFFNGLIRAKERANHAFFDSADESKFGHLRRDFEEAVTSIRGGEDRASFFHQLCGDEGDERSGTIERQDMRGACVFILKYCDQWQRFGFGSCPKASESSENQHSLIHNADRQRHIERSDRALRHAEKLSENANRLGPSVNLPGALDKALSAADEVENIRKTEKKCEEDCVLRDEQRKSEKENVDRYLSPEYEPPSGCCVSRSHGKVTCFCDGSPCM